MCIKLCSVGIVRSRTKATEFVCLYLHECVSAIVTHVGSCPVMSEYRSVPEGLSWVTVDQSAVVVRGDDRGASGLNLPFNFERSFR